MLVIDPRREHIAVARLRKLGIKVVALLDTDCDPDLIDLPIPGNDDSMRSIELVVAQLTDAIRDGKAAAPSDPPPSAESAQARGGDSRGGGDRRRGSGRGEGIRGAVKQRDPDSKAAAEAPKPDSEPAGEAPEPESTPVESAEPEPAALESQ